MYDSVFGISFGDAKVIESDNVTCLGMIFQTHSIIKEENSNGHRYTS